MTGQLFQTGYSVCASGDEARCFPRSLMDKAEMSYKTDTNMNADIAEDIVSLEIKRKGWYVLTPSSRDSPYDLVIDRNGTFETVQVKKMKNFTLPRMVGRSNQRTTVNGKVRNTVDYAERRISWLVGVDIDSGQTFWYPLEVYKDKPKSFKVTARRGGVLMHPSFQLPSNKNVRSNSTGKRVLPKV